MAKKSNEIHITRVYDAPAKLVWEVWTDLKHVAKWWGPRGFTITTKSKDLRPGGKWIYTMHGPDGVDYPNIATYHEVVPYKKLVYDHGGNEERQKLFTVTATFEEKNGKTTLNMTMALPSEEEAKKTKEFIKQAGGNSTWDRLSEYLENETQGKDIFVIQRSFETDIKTLFSMWVNPDHMAKWMGPTGSEMKFLRTNVKEGGESFYSMTMPDRSVVYGMVNYKQIAPHTLLVYTQNFADKEGQLCKPHFIANYPDRILTTITFAEEDVNQTRLTLKWEIAGNATELERQMFHGMKAGMTGGWTGSFDKLDEVISELS